ncbi:MAG TPA: deaminase [Candidatus Saccharimonadales bacterium]|nr:deaminase [Candidatus Saccharimonadales bacterium]
MNFDWGDLAFGSKQPVNKLNATFIAAPRDISLERFKQLIKTYLPKGNIILGLSQEPFVEGFADQPQFRMLQVSKVQAIIDKVNASSPKYKIYTLTYFQRETKYLFEKLKFTKVLLINGSWHLSFHHTPSYYALVNSHTDYELISPFVDEAEALAYAQWATKEFDKRLKKILPTKGYFTEKEMLELAREVAKGSFDYTYQAGVVLGKKTAEGYQLLTWSFNRVVPYQTYALHHGSLREQHFSPANDLNYYDTVHAETELLITALKQKMDLSGTTLFINLLPCPTCGRMLAETDIDEIIYSLDHSDGYTLRVLELANKKVKRIIVK